MTESRMGARQDQATLASKRSIDDLIQDCYRLERAGKMHLALQCGYQAEQLARTQGMSDLAASALSAQALVHFHLGHYPRANALAEEALVCASPNALGRAEAYIILGVCASETDDLDTAEGNFHRAVDLSREIGHHLALVRALHDLAGGVYWPRGKFDLAIATEQEVLQITAQHGISQYRENAWIGQAIVCVDKGDCRLADESLRNLESLAIPGSLSRGYYYCLKAHLCQLEGNVEAAPDLYQQALAIAETIGEPGLNVETRLGMSRFHRERADQPAAHPWAKAAVGIAHHAGFHHMEGRALIELGRVAWAMDNLEEAETCFQNAIQQLESIKAAFDLSHARLMQAVLLHQTSLAKEMDERDSKFKEKLRRNWILAAQGIIDGGYGFLFEREWKLVFPLVVSYLNDADPLASDLASKALIVLQRSPPPLKISILGRFEVRQGSRLIPSSDWRQRQAGELFRLLLVSPGRKLSREKIIEALWPEKPADAAWGSFHQTTSALRRVLEPELPDKYPSRYLFVEEGLATLYLPPGSQVDFETFERFLRRGELDAALALFRGEPFPQDMYHNWAASVREHLNQQYIAVLLSVADQKLRNNDPQGALETCRRLLSVDPWQEQGVLTGMQAHLALKDRTGAIRLYRELERCLHDDLGIAPTSELSQFYQSLL